MTLSEKLQELREIIGKATPGRWFYDGESSEASKDYGGYGFEIFTRDDDGDVADPVAVEFVEEEDAAYIAKFNPTVTDALVRVAEAVVVERHISRDPTVPPEERQTIRADMDNALAALEAALEEQE